MTTAVEVLVKELREDIKQQRELLIRHMDKEEREREEIMRNMKVDKEEYMGRLDKIERKLTVWATVIHTLKVVGTIALLFLTLKFGDIKAIFKQP